MYYVEYGKNDSKLIFSEKDGYLSQYAGSNELEVPSKLDKVSPASNRNQQRRPLHVNGSPSQRLTERIKN